MAHALHPNYADKHDPDLAPRLGSGLVLKHNVNQRYATTSISATLFRWALGPVMLHRRMGVAAYRPSAFCTTLACALHDLLTPQPRAPSTTRQRAGRCAGARGCPPQSLRCAPTWRAGPPLGPSWPAGWACARWTSACRSWPCTASARCEGVHRSAGQGGGWVLGGARGRWAAGLRGGAGACLLLASPSPRVLPAHAHAHPHPCSPTPCRCAP